MNRKPNSQEASICVVCAWRKDCVKKFSFSGQHCLEFTRDITLVDKPLEKGGKAEQGKGDKTG